MPAEHGPERSPSRTLALMHTCAQAWRSRRLHAWLLLPLLALAALLYMKYAMASTFTVNSTADTGGSTCSGTCTLRQAIGAANAAGVGPHTININISGCSSGCTITVGSDLPTLTHATVVNGTAQSGFTNAPLIRIDGSNNRSVGIGLGSGSSGSTIRGLVLSRFTTAGIRIDSSNNLIAGNYVGTDLTGNAASGNANGIYVSSGTGNTIGGQTSADRNVVSGNSNDAIWVVSNNNIITGNYVGVGANGSTALGNAYSAVYLDKSVSGNRIGGTTTGEANVLANNSLDGITLGVATGTGTGNSWLGNSIYANGNLGIDLEDNGVTANDVGDADSGVNGRQNFPVITTATTNTLTTTVIGTLNSNANTTYRLEFFSSATGDSTGYGEGQVYLGSTSVTTNGSGNASYSQVLSTGATVGHKISATATVDLGGGNFGSSSEFAQNVTAASPPAGFTVSAISGNTSEAGGTATFTVVLDRAPTANVTIGVSSNNTIEGTVSTPSLVFTSANWYTPQTVTVTGQDDTLVDGDRAYSIVLAAATSADSAYNGLNPSDVAVTNTDNDTQSTIVVTTNTDVVDGNTSSLYALLSNKGADGQISLREALTAANATANGSGGPDIINFAVGSGSFSISLGSSLPAVAQPTIINGWSQTGYTSTPLVIIDCNQLGAIGLQLNAGASGSTLRGLIVRDCSSHAIRIDASSNGNTVQGNYLGSYGAAGTDQGVGEQNVGAGLYVAGANNILGGNSATTRNVIGGNQSHGVNFSGATATGNLLQGNYIGLNAAGAAAVANGANGVMVDTSAAGNVIGTNLDGSNDATEGNVISGNTATGIQMWGAGSANTVRGNLIGVNPAATATLPNLNMGLQIGGATTNTVIGGTTAVAANVIGGNSWNAIEILTAGTTGTTVQGNYIGTNSGGVLNLGNGGGIEVFSGAASNTIGGTAAGAGNVVAFNGAVGVGVSGAGTGNAVLSNLIYSNTGLGIDLGANGVTANDAGDADTGANNLQNYPVLSGALKNSAGTQITISGTLNSVASTPFRIEFYSNTTADGSGYGEGQRLLGSANVTTDGSGNATINAVLTIAVSTGDAISATATRSNAGFTAFTDTSEFSANVVAAVPTYPISGTVYEDIHYGGGAGRTLVASAGVGVSGATVELYSPDTGLMASTTTNGSGGYTFTGVPNGGYFVRVVQSTVASTRSGSVPGLLAVQTWRYEASWMTGSPISNEVGGARPDTADSSAATALAWTSCAAENATCTLTGTRLVRYGVSPNFTTQVVTDSVVCDNATFGDPAAGFAKTCAILNPHLHSASGVQVASAAVSGVNFGFNFSTVVNTNDSGQGSLRQAITNANTLANTGLAQTSRTAGTETLIFTISNGTTGAGGSLGLSGGMRTSNNLFSGGVATITPTTPLPTLSTPMEVDAQAQPGWTNNPVVHINAATAGGNALLLTGGATVLRGLGVRGAATGIRISGSSGSTIEGCWVGTTAAGTAAAANSQGVWIDSSSSNVVGGNNSAKRNVLSGNVSNGLVLNNAVGTVVKGNYLGLNATGTAAVPNGDSGIVLIGSSTGTLIGGTAAGEGNFIAGNSGIAGGTSGAISIQTSTSTGSVIRGNIIGMKADQSAAIASVGYGIYVPAANTTIGGTAAGAGNRITAHSLDGVAVTGTSTTGVSIQGNHIYGNTGIGIDLADNGATANDGVKTASQPNLLMDHPVFTSATLSGTTLTVTGYVGTAAGQTAFAAARVEVFIADGSSAAGQGSSYLGFVTADANGNFSGAITGVTGVTLGTSLITGTATDGSGNTSEFGTNATIGWGVTGTVFEDVNYGGGAGRSLAAAAGVGLVGATVELYNSGGVWVRSTTTASGGAYSFTGLAAGTYQVRVVGGTVQSQRTGSSGALRGVMTYRTTAASGTAVAVTDQVGGTTPALVDPAAGSAGATFNTTTGVFSAVLAGTAQSFAPAVVSTATVAGVDFGFNFDTVVNTNASGTGSLHQVITNANAFSDDGTLAVAGRTAALEHVVFMLADGTTRPGLRNTFASQFAAGVASITPTTALPTLAATLVVDAQLQPGWVQDPIIELRGNLAGAVAGLTLNAGAAQVRGLIINRYSAAGLSVTGGAGHTVQGCWIGTDATGTAAAANAGSGIAVSASPVGLQIGGTTAAQRNVVSGNTGYGVYVAGGSGIVLQGNYVGTNAAGTAAVANTSRGVFLDTAVSTATLGGTAAGAGNVISGNPDYAVWLAGGGTTVQGNFIGTNAAGTAALANSYGIWVATSGHTIGGTSANARNVVSGNTNRGIWLNAGGNTVQGNYVGTNAAGTAALPNTDGIYVKGVNNVIGGSAAGASNLVSGNSAVGVLLHAVADGSTVQGNVIGRNASQAAALPNAIGVSVACSNGCAVGGSNSGEGNVVSGNTGAGVSVASASQSNAILRNSIYGNSGIGIDLNANGLSVNDGAKTAGTGNQLMDHPVFTSARARGNQLTVAGYVGTAAGQSLFANARVEIFTSDQDASGYGEGQTYLGFVTTDASGNFNTTLTMAASVLAAGTRLTGTATDSSNNTSEFGANFSGLVVDLVVNHNGDFVDANPGDGICQTATAGQCTLRAALQELNALAVQPSPLTIAFALPGCSAGTEAACVITPATNLPTAVKAVVVDGSTQAGYSTRPLVALAGPGSGTATALEMGAGAGGSTVRALRFAGWTSGTGTTLNLTTSNSHTVQGNWFGLDGSGVATVGAANRSGVTVQGGSSSNLIGGTTTAQRNVVAGSAAWGIDLLTGSGNQVLGNWFGLNADGSSNAQSANNVALSVRSTAALVGGVLAGEGNRFGPATLHHISVDTNAGAVSTASALVRGNLIGFNGAGAAVASGSDAILINAGVSNTTIGGTQTAAANSITGSSGRAIGIAAGSGTLATVQGNSIYGNTGIGIDLGRNGVTANDGSTNASQANNGIDHPVVTGAGLAGDGASVTVIGYIGTGSGQAAFAGSRVEIFKAAPDASGYGQGQTYLGYLTADGNGRFSGTLTITVGALVVGNSVTATASDAAGNTSEFGPNFTSTTMAGLSPASFNAFETDTIAGALTGAIRSKVAGTAASLAVLALDSAGTAPHSGFSGSVQLNWLDTRDDSGAFTGSCRASWPDLGAAGTATFSNNNRVDVALTPPATSTKAMRLKMTYVGPGGTVVACSNDAFAALPAQLAWLGASDTSSDTAGITRTLDTVVASGGAVHQAGRPFTLRAQALTSGGAVMTAYDGTPALAITGCVLPAGCTAGALAGGSVAAAAGLYTHNSVTYSEVGAITVQLTDTTYANVDAADTALGTRTFGSSGLPVGRFVPDSYAVTVSTSGVLDTASAACMAAGSGATFLGQSFTWATVPAVTVTARNAAGTTTALWTGSLMKLAPGASLVPSLAVASAGSASLATSWGASTVTALGGGQARLQANALDRFVLDVAAGTYQAPTTPTWQWQLAVADSSEAGTAGNPQPSATATQASVLFNQGGSFYSGRLALAAAHGDARSGVRMLVQLQRYSSAGWVTLTEDRGCVTVQRSQVEVSAPSGVFVGAGVCAAPLAAGVTTAGGRAWLALPAAPSGAPGRLSVRVAGSAASGDACSPAGAVQAITPLGLPWLTGGTSGAGPQASATWGRPQRDAVLRREFW